MRPAPSNTLEFIDTNVLVYAYDASVPGRHEVARTLVSRLGVDRAGAISVQVLQEFYVTVTRKIRRQMAPEVARDRLRVFGHWPVHAPTADDVVAATILSEENTLSFWDAMIINSASVLGCTRIWSEDLNPGQVIAGVEVINPFT